MMMMSEEKTMTAKLELFLTDTLKVWLVFGSGVLIAVGLVLSLDWMGAPTGLQYGLAALALIAYFAAYTFPLPRLGGPGEFSSLGSPPLTAVGAFLRLTVFLAIEVGVWGLARFGYEALSVVAAAHILAATMLISIMLEFLHFTLRITRYTVDILFRAGRSERDETSRERRD